MSLDVVRICGAPWERGRHFGLQRHSQIRACMGQWLADLRTAGLDSPESYIERMVEETEFTSAIQKYTPDILEEVRGIAYGSGLPLRLVFGAQLMDEEWLYRGVHRAKAALAPKCSSIAIRLKAGSTWVGQNMDIGAHTDGHQFALRVCPEENDVGAMIFTVGCMIGLMGVNASGVAVCVNALSELPFAGHGLPVAFVIRKLLQARSAAEAATVLGGIPHASGQHYLIADPVEIRSFEACSAGVTEYHPPDPAVVVHTNHPLTNIELRNEAMHDRTNSIARLKSLQAHLTRENCGLEAIKAALSAKDDAAHPVCIERGVGRTDAGTGACIFTTGSIISVLSKSTRAVEVWMTAGPPKVWGYERFELDPFRSSV